MTDLRTALVADLDAGFAEVVRTYQGLLFGDEHTVWDGIRLRFGRTF